MIKLWGRRKTLSYSKEFLADATYIAYNPESTDLVLTQTWETLYSWMSSIASPLRGVETSERNRVYMKCRTIGYDIASHSNLSVVSMERILREGYHYSCLGLLANPNVTYDILTLMRTNNHMTIRGYLVKSAKCPPELLRVFEGDDDYIKMEITANPHTPTDALVDIASGRLVEDENILLGLVCNPSLPVAVAAELLTYLGAADQGKLGDRVIPSPVLVEVLKDEYPGVHNEMPRDWLEKLWVGVKA